MMPVSAREIVERVAREHDTTVVDIFSNSKFQEHVLARWAAVKQIHEEHPTWSMARIGRFMGRDHTTIQHVFRKQGLKAAMGGRARKRPWSDEDNAYLLEEWPKGTAYRPLEERLRRSASTIRRQAEELGLPPRPLGRKCHITEDDVREIRASPESRETLAQTYGVTPDHIRKIQRRHRRRRVL
jgi:hypothetical protein